MAFSFFYPSPLPSTKNWGPGWSPGDQTCSNIRPRIKPHSVFQGGVHERIWVLVNLLAKECERKGYRFKDGWSWGFACRATKGGDGTTPSFHSWGLALDINAPENPFSSTAMNTSDLANDNRWVIALFRKYGFFWLGPSIGDTMHVHFAGNPRDARRMTRKAKADFAPSFVVAGKEFKRIGRAVRRVRNLLEDGKNRVTVKARGG